MLVMKNGDTYLVKGSVIKELDLEPHNASPPGSPIQYHEGLFPSALAAEGTD
jgi:hypothetical protein